MSLIGTLIVRVEPGAKGLVRGRLTSMAGAEIVSEADAGFAVLLEGETPRQQAKCHEEIARWRGVREALVIFQGRGD
jgi:hypothetical protein